MGALQTHLSDAISLNLSRMPIYGELSKGKSLPLSKNLIRAGKFIMPFARRIDKSARKLNRQGIPILQEDLIPIENLPAPETAPTYTNVLSKQEALPLQEEMDTWLKEVKALRKAGFLREICESSYEMLEKVEGWEDKHQCHFAMTRYLMKSLAFNSYKGLGYLGYRSNSILLSKRLIKGHSFFMPWTISFDRKAHHVQAMGVGFLVNDFPEIPFKSEWEINRNKSWAK